MSRTRKMRVAPLALLALSGVALAGCSMTDPYERAGIWRPSGVNEANIAAQVANPGDLARGRGDAGGSVRGASGAVERLWQGGAGPRQANQQGGQQGGGLGQRAGGPEAQR
jgi:hypothetical protein